ncbi:MAG: iron-containing redox enzyme family protein [Spirulinaceae cyanobacterium]
MTSLLINQKQAPVSTPISQKQKLNQILNEVVSQHALENHLFVKQFAAGNFSQDAIRKFAMKMLPGSNRFNQAFLKVTAKMSNYRARTIMLENAFTEHGELDADKAHVALFMRFMRGIDCPRVDLNEDDGAFRIPALRFKKFEVCDDEPIVRSLGRFAVIEQILPGIFPNYIEGLRKIFPGIEDQTIEYFHIHCILDPEHTDELLEVAQMHIQSEDDIALFQAGVQDMALSIQDMFTWMGDNLEVEASKNL